MIGLTDNCRRANHVFAFFLSQRVGGTVDAATQHNSRWHPVADLRV